MARIKKALHITRIKQESQNPNLKLAINAKDDNGIPPN
jgi:hypothetical protein